jgi:hypothetical protein
MQTDAISALLETENECPPYLVRPVGEVKVLNANHPPGITPEVLKVIQAAASVYLGRQVNITSVKVLSATNKIPSSWEDEGRRMAQTSHNQVQRGH